MAFISVSADDLMAAAVEIQATASRIEADRQRLQTLIDGLGDSWQGSAASTFQSIYDKWNFQFSELVNTLAEFSRGLQAAGEAYSETLAAVSQAFSPGPTYSAYGGSRDSAILDVTIYLANEAIHGK